MFPIIETHDEVKLLINDIRDRRIFCIPILLDYHLHSCINNISLLYVYNLETSNEYIVSVNHSEALTLDSSILSEILSACTYAYVYDIKTILKYDISGNVYDAKLVHYFLNNFVINDYDFDTNIHTHFVNKFYNVKSLNYLLPIMKHFEKCSEIAKVYVEFLINFHIDVTYTSYNQILKNLYSIEAAGIYVDPNRFHEHFKQTIKEDSLVYSEYNLYTSTGRPSNRYGGINFAALNKENGDRSVFKSRFEDGIMLQFDYDSYHVRLLGNLLNCDLPKQNMHTFLGKMYFNTDTLTAEQYTLSKGITFKQFYGGVSKEYAHIDIFRAVSNYTKILWNQYKTAGYIETPIFHRKLSSKFYNDMTPQKLLNYQIQALEMEQTMVMLSSFLEGDILKESKLVLYTYDSFLIDFKLSDGKETVVKIKEMFEQNHAFPCTVHYGNTYDDMKILNLS